MNHEPSEGVGGTFKSNWIAYLGLPGLPGLEAPPCDIPSGCCFFTGPWTVTRSSLRMLRRVAAFCRPLRPVLLLFSFPRSRSPVVGVLGLCWMWRDVPFARQRHPIVGPFPFQGKGPRKAFLSTNDLACSLCKCTCTCRLTMNPNPTNHSQRVLRPCEQTLSSASHDS